MPWPGRSMRPRGFCQRSTVRASVASPAGPRPRPLCLCPSGPVVRCRGAARRSVAQGFPCWVGPALTSSPPDGQAVPRQPDRGARPPVDHDAPSRGSPVTSPRPLPPKQPMQPRKTVASGERPGGCGPPSPCQLRCSPSLLSGWRGGPIRNCCGPSPRSRSVGPLGSCSTGSAGLAMCGSCRNGSSFCCCRDSPFCRAAPEVRADLAACPPLA